MNRSRSMHRYTDAQVAEACHGAAAGLRSATGDGPPVPPWQYLAPDLKAAAIEGVRRVRLVGTPLSPREHHADWVAFMTARGWQPGPRDPLAKTHPDLVHWDDLPPGSQDQDRMFIAITVALTLDDLLLAVLAIRAASVQASGARA